MGRPRSDTREYDEIVVSVLASGGRLPGRIAPADAWEATRRLAARGYSDGQIAVIVNRTRTHVRRIRSAMGVPAPCLGLGGSTRPVEAPTRPVALK